MKAKGSSKTLQTSNRHLAAAAAEAQAAGKSAAGNDAALRQAKKRYKTARKTLKQAKKAARKARKLARKTQRKLEGLVANHAKLRKTAQKAAGRKSAKLVKAAKSNKRREAQVPASPTGSAPPTPEISAKSA
jgi:hypothetical protein